MSILTGKGILQNTGILDGRGILFQSGIIVPPSIDPDAAARIAQIKAAGATVTPQQEVFISNFFYDAKAAGYYPSLKRLYLPIWGVAAANAIDMIGGTSGTFNGGVTHGAGFVQGNGSTGYFNSGTTPASIDFTTINACYGAICKSPPTNNPSTIVSSFDGVGAESDLLQFSTDLIAWHANRTAPDSQTTFTQNFADQTGIILYTNTAGVRKIHRKKLSVFSSASGATGDSGTLPTANYHFMTDSRIVNISDAQYGAFFLSLGLSDANAESFSNHLYTLYESTSGVTLP